ncbi:MAG: HAD family hydrolase [Planctomycetales bacterium 71-10]|nr:MAG: HAD family hydrolase [Planctomycetales bacterium 71-10]
MSANRPLEFSLAAIDIDETLIGHDGKIGRANREAIAGLRSRGCRVVLASGRRHANMLPYCAELGLDDFVVSSQGARVEHASTGQILHWAEMEPATAAALTVEGLSRGFSVLLWLADRVLAQTPSEWIGRYERLTNDPVEIVDLATLADRPAEKVIWAAHPDVVSKEAEAMRRRLDGRALTTITEPWSLEFSAQEADKRHGVAALARHLGIPRERVMAFGDGNNDAGMLAWAGMGVAMPHGRPSARAAARLVAPDGDPESALARGVEAVLRRAEGALVA